MFVHSSPTYSYGCGCRFVGDPFTLLLKVGTKVIYRITSFATPYTTQWTNSSHRLHNLSGSSLFYFILCHFCVRMIHDCQPHRVQFCIYFDFSLIFENERVTVLENSCIVFFFSHIYARRINRWRQTSLLSLLHNIIQLYYDKVHSKLCCQVWKIAQCKTLKWWVSDNVSGLTLKHALQLTPQRFRT